MVYSETNSTAGLPPGNSLAEMSLPDLSSYLPPIVMLGALAAYLGWKPPKPRTILKNWLMSRIEVRWTDNIFEALEDFLAQEWVCKMSTHRLATTGSRLPWNKNEPNSHEEHVMGTTPPRTCSLPSLTLTPANGNHWFIYEGRLILLEREEREDAWERSQSLHLMCFGWDGSILRKILHAARLRHAELDENKTAVYRAQSNNKSIAWTRASGQGIRELSTVIMDPDLQKKFIEDIDGYLQPETRRWHTERGIPYRRGYLFEGPPGTGKTSLCIAVAGLFKLKIYILNLNNIAEDDLNNLISSLPQQCILLLEDVDSQKITNSRTTEPDNSFTTFQRLSLSGLLNAIDGVIASEGRILIMTTNHKDKLDPALIRPGRVDMTISFEYPDFDSIKRLFLLMYAEYPVEEKKEQQQPASSQCQFCPRLQPSPPANIPGNNISQDELQALANTFAASFPEKEYSQARILGYLKKHSGKPKRAVNLIAELFGEEE
ncbi:mitochondrial chaperone bcs1, putative [Talaromyces stipitatus ATCC 10500]|uniref:Mitochondrial chaperone bcs1, putative n=1 Tax=Talaromyces stipitatus (strain ATCC 10500 / CBS 375.48 / QM 6759 / NRRL 1006) TaxID=441959 RepID=B8MPP1_TALSN|nr:mitochondrial chaperone bcs1, putative [Talaromyces stipitatus ATCC 10500]EED14480.1 mitochondrial chaperone bcs1, putative [Talaromyces stipitatus ATCC 10500]